MQHTPLLPIIHATDPSQARTDVWDCACVRELPAKPIVAALSGPLLRQPGAQLLPLAAGWQACYNPAGPVGIAVLGAPAWQVLEAFDSPLTAADLPTRLPGIPSPVAGTMVDGLARVGLLRSVVQPEPGSARVSTLSAWLHVTDACNLACPYCYVRQRLTAMSAKIGRATVDRLVQSARRHGYTSLRLKYAGGEPFLHFPVVHAIHTHAVQRAAEANLGLEEIVLTNGVGVTDAMLDFVARAGMWLMISLDGGASGHDRVRPRWDGTSSYAQVRDTVERALDRGLSPNISITLTSLNLEGVEEAVEFALERRLRFNLNFYRQRSPSGADSEDLPSLAPEPVQLAKTLLGVFDLIWKTPDYPLSLAGILDRVRLDAGHEHACSAGHDYLVVSTEGQVSACQMLLDEPWCDVTHEDPLGAIRQRGGQLFESVQDQGDCQTCPWRAACGGGCPLMRGTVLHSQYCEVYRALLPELVRLEARRLLASSIDLRI